MKEENYNVIETIGECVIRLSSATLAIVSMFWAIHKVSYLLSLDTVTNAVIIKEVAYIIGFGIMVFGGGYIFDNGVIINNLKESIHKLEEKRKIICIAIIAIIVIIWIAMIGIFMSNLGL